MKKWLRGEKRNQAEKKSGSKQNQSQRHRNPFMMRKCILLSVETHFERRQIPGIESEYIYAGKFLPVGQMISRHCLSCGNATKAMYLQGKILISRWH